MITELLYQLALLLYPKPYREEYGELMIQHARDLQKELRNPFVFWYVMLKDGVPSLLREHYDYYDGRLVPISPLLAIAISGIVMLPGFVFVLVGLSNAYAPGNQLIIMLNEARGTGAQQFWFDNISPFVFLGGLAISIMLNASSVFRVKIDSGVTVRISYEKVVLLNGLLLTASTVMLSVLVGYVVLENWPCITGVTTVC